VSITKEAADPTLISKISIAFSFSSVFWMDASSIGTITQGLKGICNLPAAQSSGLDGSPESALHWIGSLKENYIMVFDNADVLSPAELEAYLPPGRGGNILITSCNSTMRNLTLPENSLEISEMEKNNAIELLLKASCLDPFSMEFQGEASEIVKELFCLPLAIDQAGAFIASGATTIGDYLEKYLEHRKILLSHSEFTGAFKYNRSVYGTWELSYKEIQKKAESDDSHRANAANSAMLLLGLFSYFHHEKITEKIFSYAALQKDQKTSNTELLLASSTLNQRLLPMNKAGTWDSSFFREGIRVLLSFSLIKKTPPSDSVYAMHPLVHAWGRDRLPLNERKKYCLMAYVILSSSLRKDESQPYEFQRVLVTHVRANMKHSELESGQNVVDCWDDAYVKFGDLLLKQGYLKEAETLEIKVLDTRNRILGVEHPDTIYAMGNLAKTYGSLGKHTEAEKLKIQILDTRNRILGVEHPLTIHAMGNLARTYHSLGKYAEAEKLKIQVLDARNRFLGVEHPDTIRAMANLAATYHSLGKYTDAEKLKIQVLDARNRILGVQHPDTINAMESLAKTYYSLGKYIHAEKLKAQVLDSRIKSPGPEPQDAMASDIATNFLQCKHPHVIEAMTNLAPNSKQLVLVAKTALHHLQQHEAEIKDTLSGSKISERDYILLAGFNESGIHSGIGYVEEIHVLWRKKYLPKKALLRSLGRIFSPFPGVIFTTHPPYCFRTPVFDSGGKAQEWDEVLFIQAHTYTTHQIRNTMKEKEMMLASICLSEGKVLSGSGSGGGRDGNEKKSGENIPQGKRIGGNPQKGSEKCSEGDNDDPEGGDPNDSDSRDNSDTHLPQISFNIQTEIYANAPPVLASGPSSKPSKHFQLLQLEGSIIVQVSISSKLNHMKTFNVVLDKTFTAETKESSKLLYPVQKTKTPRHSRGRFCLLPPFSLEGRNKHKRETHYI